MIRSFSSSHHRPRRSLIAWLSRPRSFRRFAMFAAFLACFTCRPTAAQRPAGHPGSRTGAVRVPVPRTIPPPPARGGFAHPHPLGSLRTAGLPGPGVRLGPGPTLILRQPFLFGTRSFWSEEAYNFYWAPGCRRVLASSWLGAPGYDLGCNPFGGSLPPENYVVRPVEELSPYVFGLEGSELVWLYLKDGTVFGVTDYWFVNGEVHFRMAREEPAFGPEGARKGSASEHVIGLDELDVARTIEVNTARGFRVVRRDEPLERFLRDHPNDTPAPLTAPQSQ